MKPQFGAAIALANEIESAEKELLDSGWGGYPWEHLGDASRDIAKLIRGLREANGLIEQLETLRVAALRMLAATDQVVDDSPYKDEWLGLWAAANVEELSGELSAARIRVEELERELVEALVERVRGGLLPERRDVDPVARHHQQKEAVAALTELAERLKAAEMNHAGAWADFNEMRKRAEAAERERDEARQLYIDDECPSEEFLIARGWK